MLAKRTHKEHLEQLEDFIRGQERQLEQERLARDHVSERVSQLERAN